MTEERGHAELGGSSAGRWHNCTGSIFLYRDLPPEGERPDAKRGTEVHSVCEKHLEGFLMERETGTPNGFKTEDEEAYKLAQGYVETLWEKVLLKSITGKAYGIEDQFILDEKLKMSGYIDFWSVYIDDRGKRVGVIVDYKNGYYGVDSHNNAQLAFYACALLAEMQRHGKGLDYVRAVIYQPNAGKEDPYCETKFTFKQLVKWQEKFAKAAETIYVQQQPKFKTGSWCRFCRAQAKCPKYSKELSAKTALKLVDPEKIELPEPQRVSDSVLAQIILNADKIESYINACKQYAIERAKQGSNLPGIKAVNSAPRRKWKENREEIIKHFESLHIPIIKPVTKPDLIPLTEVEKSLAKNVGATEAKQIINQFVDYSLTSVILVPENDPRPSIQAAKDKLENYENKEI